MTSTLEPSFGGGSDIVPRAPAQPAAPRQREDAPNPEWYARLRGRSRIGF